MSYSLATLWYERQRYLPGVLAVGFSCLLIALQCGLLLGLFSITSIPIDESRADIWIGHPEVPSVDLGRPIPESWMSLLSQPEVETIEPFMEGFGYWVKPNGGMELVLIIGSRLGPGAIGPVRQLSAQHRMLLSEEMSVVVDEGEFSRLGITKIGDYAEVIGRRVRVVGTVRGLKSLAGPYLFCSVETGKALLRPPPDQVTFILGKCTNKADAQKVVDRLQAYPQKISAFTADGFSLRSRLHWLLKTKAGIALGLAAALGLLVGAVVTYQTLYAATAASLKEYAVLRALGIPRWRMALTVLAQSFWVGLFGICLAVPFILILASLGNDAGAKVLLPWWLWTGAISVTMTTALVSGLLALRSLRLVEPATLLR
ncbi:MAG: ABC transporter permease [Gemmataceae bacterium]|nr:ABC transporter permease [Gemmataceae bacterium]MCI0743435.1 ABC transporter permease [Gemmataceae bacterium]